MDLRIENERLKPENTKLRQLLKEALKRVEELEGQLRQNSSNSNWPSSRDKGRKKKAMQNLRRKSDKKPGGQPGHEKHTLAFGDKPHHVAVHRPEKCTHCEQAIEIKRRQVIDLPPLEVEVTEHQVERVVCPRCGQASEGEFPEGVSQPVQYGAGVKSLAVYLKGEQLLPYGRSRQVLADLFGPSVTQGSLENFINAAATTLEPITQQIKAGLVAAEVIYYDESGFYIDGKRQWLHSAATSQLTYYGPHPSRGKKALEAMGILPHFTGVALHDNWSAYWHYGQCQHALSPDKLAQIERLYTNLVAAALKANPPSPDGWPKGARGRPKKPKPRNLAERFAKHRTAVLTFVYDFKVPFDNNLAERDIRMLKVQQKISGCFRSPVGAQAFCAICSYISTIRKQNLSVWLALNSLFSGPILLPAFPLG
jgi:transposase